MRNTATKTKFKNNEKGITLIALVITIIVLLILAGIAISAVTGRNGLLRQALSSKTKSDEEATIEKIKLAVTASITNVDHKVDEEKLNKELTSDFGEKGTGYKLDPYDGSSNEYKLTIGDMVFALLSTGELMPTNLEATELTTAVSEKTIYEDTTSVNTINRVVIPEGFKLSSKPTEQKIDTGLVVIAPDGSEFVWIPVENAVYDSTNENASKIPTSRTKGTLQGYTYTPMSIKVDGEYKGLIYSFKSDGGAFLSYPDESKKYQGTDYREPDYLADDTSTGDATESGLELLKEVVGLNESKGDILVQWKKQLQNEYNEMVKSIEKYHGFYVSRYEMSFKTVEGTNIAQSVKNATPATGKTANTWYGLYQINKEFSEKNNLSSIVGSSMIWGSQYDQMMIWMRNNGIDVASTTPIDGAALNTEITTGSVETDKLNNVYDLLGCNYEWTLEAYKTEKRIIDGGFRTYSKAPSGSYYQAPNNQYLNACSRTTLYVK